MPADGRRAGATNDGGGDLLHLFEEGSLLLVTTAGVDDDDLIALLLELLHALLGDLDGIGLGVAAVEGDLGLGGVLLELIERTGTEGVGAHEAGLPALPLVVVGQLGDGGGLASTLESYEHDDIGLALDQLVGLLAGINQSTELIEHGLAEESETADR